MNLQKLDGNQKFWLTIWAFIFTTVVLLVSLVVHSAQQYNKLKIEALSKTVDPISFACAEQISSSSVAKADAIICMEKVKK